MAKKSIAILGATSHIAKNLIYNFYKKRDTYEIKLFARNKEKTKEFCIKENLEIEAIHDFENFGFEFYDVVINCVGIGTPSKLKDNPGEIFEITEKYDNMCINYIKNNKNTLYINLSSGAVFGKSFDKGISEETKAEIEINHLNQNDFYALAKINSEAKHRALNSYNIVDLRIFAFFSRFIDLDGKYLITEIINSLKEKKIFKTTPIDIVRDYVHHEDFFYLVECCIKQPKINDVFDVYSAKPVTKFEILANMAEKMELKYEIDGDTGFVNATGVKNRYYSENRKAAVIGYTPKYTSIECIEEESRIILKG